MSVCGRVGGRLERAAHRREHRRRVRLLQQQRRQLGHALRRALGGAAARWARAIGRRRRATAAARGAPRRGVVLLLGAPEIVNGGARIGGAVELQRHGGVQRVRLAVRGRQRPPAGRRLPRGRQMLAGDRHLRGAARELRIADGRGLRIALGGAAAVATLQGGFRDHGERGGIGLRGARGCSRGCSAGAPGQQRQRQPRDAHDFPRAEVTRRSYSHPAL